MRRAGGAGGGERALVPAPDGSVTVVTGLGGRGMTMSPALAEENVAALVGRSAETSGGFKFA